MGAYADTVLLVSPNGEKLPKGVSLIPVAGPNYEIGGSRNPIGFSDWVCGFSLRDKYKVLSSSGLGFSSFARNPPVNILKDYIATGIPGGLETKSRGTDYSRMIRDIVGTTRTTGPTLGVYHGPHQHCAK